MAGGSSRSGSYFLGALVGLLVSVAMAVALSILAPVGGAPQKVAMTPAPQPQVQEEPEPQPAPQPAATPAPEPEPEPQPQPTAQQPEPAPAPQPEPQEQEVAVAAPEPEPVEEQPAPAPAPAIINELPPYKANAEIYNGDRSQPLLSIVLVSDPADRALMDELLLLPGPLSVIVPPDADDAETMILDIRDAGFEALLGADGPNATSVAAQAAGARVIGVALLGEVAGSNDVAEAVAPQLADGGLALLDVSKEGGGVPLRAAKTNGVPAAPGGRYFDEIQSSAMVFQSLERAAFDARRTGAFVVIGKAHPAVLTGLRRWMNVKANKSVNVAPLSVVIDKVSRQ